MIQISFGCCGHFIGDVDNVSITLISAPWWHRWYSPLLQWGWPLVSQSLFAESVRVGVGMSRCTIVLWRDSIWQYEHVIFLISLSLQCSYVLIMGPAFDGTLVFKRCVSIFNHSAKIPFQHTLFTMSLVSCCLIHSSLPNAWNNAGNLFVCKFTFLPLYALSLNPLQQYVYLIGLHLHLKSRLILSISLN